MKLRDFVKKYEFHDSLLEKISYDEVKKELYMYIDFCYWMHKNYEDSMHETGMIVLLFSGVDNYSGLKGEFDSYIILNVKFVDKMIKFSVLDDGENEYHEILIKSDNVEFSEVEENVDN